MLIVDLILFFIFPLVCWETCREIVGDYPAMILTTIPGILYSIYRFKNNQKLTFTGVFVILNLIVGLLLDLLSGSALQLLWNNIFYSLTLLVIYSISLIVKRPLYLFFALDLMTLKGYDRKITKELFFEKKIYKLFILTTIIYCTTELIYIFCLLQWILKYGVEAYRLDIILDNILNILLSGTSFVAFIILQMRMNEITPVKNISLVKARRRNVNSIQTYSKSIHFELAFFYFSTH
ncbi:MAG: VC0807 family protein [Heyndrickxia sp.]